MYVVKCRGLSITHHLQGRGRRHLRSPHVPSTTCAASSSAWIARPATYVAVDSVAAVGFGASRPSVMSAPLLVRVRAFAGPQRDVLQLREIYFFLKPLLSSSCSSLLALKPCRSILSFPCHCHQARRGLGCGAGSTSSPYSPTPYTSRRASGTAASPRRRVIKRHCDTTQNGPWCPASSQIPRKARSSRSHLRAIRIGRRHQAVL